MYDLNDMMCALSCVIKTAENTIVAVLFIYIEKLQRTTWYDTFKDQIANAYD